VALIGAGGIGFDVAEFLTQSGESASVNPEKFYAEWGIDPGYRAPGGLRPAQADDSPRQVHLLQRKKSKVGDGLGKTTGWIHRTSLKARHVNMVSSVTYRKIDDAGLHVTIDGQEKLMPVDNVVLCAGQEPQRDLYADLQSAGCTVHLIGGADVAAELDAKRAIDQGVRLAATI
jgi:2,4-dienoyl-CoA reductase (NADPH2)